METDTAGHHVCYRRVGRVNELVIDGFVYDEYEKILENAHELSAHLDGHLFAVGLTEDTKNYLFVDGECIKKKLRLW